jgi:hypothetical protein
MYNVGSCGLTTSHSVGFGVPFIGCLRSHLKKSCAQGSPTRVRLRAEAGRRGGLAKAANDADKKKSA